MSTKSLIGALVPGSSLLLKEKEKKGKTLSADEAAKQAEAAADEAARKLRAREYQRAGTASTLSSGTTDSSFGSIGGKTKLG